MAVRTQLNSGTTVGHFLVLEKLGQGAMGEVYRAHDPRLGRDVAIKVLAATPDADRLSRFEREARAMALLAHPHIVTIFDVGVEGDLPFLVCELLEGETLRQYLAAGAVEPRRAVELTLAIARGIAAAHALKIVHRDLKPENLFLTNGGILKILDFGLAKLKIEQPAAPDTVTRDATMPGTLIGTPTYMAPEQVRGEPADERTDIFAIGTILYEMLSGQNPFRKRTGAETLAAILHLSPPPLPGRAELPVSLERLMLRCLEKDPADRFQSAADLVAALESSAQDLSRPATLWTMPTSEQQAASLAVLPLADMSPGRDQDWLCEGIAEELINSLTQIEGVRVAARSASFQFRAQGGDIQAIGMRLGVGSVLEGSVRKIGDRLRVTVQLVDVAEGYQRWSQRFDRTAADVFAIQDEIAECVATALRGFFSPREKVALRRPETTVEAYEYLLRGRQLLNRWRRAAMEQARTMFERAIEIDPNYAPAWAGLASVHGWLYEWWGGGAADVGTAERASLRALELAPGLSEAHAARGFVLSLARRYDEAEREFEEAIRINPNSFDAYYIYARTCFAWGRVEQSAKLFRQAGELRPEDFQSALLLAQSLQMLGLAEEAREAGLEGLRRAERQLELDPNDVRALSLGATGLILLGKNDKALQWSNRALELCPDDQGVMVNSACVRARAGQKEDALDLLEQVFSRGWGKREWIEHDPDYDSIRDDPRFKAMLERLH